MMTNSTEPTLSPDLQITKILEHLHKQNGLFQSGVEQMSDEVGNKVGPKLKHCLILLPTLGG